MKKDISITEITKAAKEVGEEVSSFEWHGLEVKVRHTLTTSEVEGYVNKLATLAFDEESGEYIPEIMMLAKPILTVSYYSNINLPKDPIKAYGIIFTDGLYEEINKIVAKSEQASDIHYAIKEKLSYLKMYHSSAAHADTLKILSGLEKLGESLGAAFEGVDPDAVNALVTNMANLDEAKIVKALVTK